jgi:dipeptidyl-peptidase-4
MPPSLGRLAAAGLVAACLTNTTMADELTIDRLFAAPDLNGAALRGLRFSPDNGRVTWLQGAADDKDRLDLWEYDLKSRATRRLVDSRSLVPAEEKLSVEEEARRERQRTASFRGIVDYEFASNGRALLFPLNGDMYRYDLDAPAAQAVRRLTSTPDAETDPKFSPRGRYVSYVRAQDLYTYDLAANVEKRLTADGGGLVSNGVAEFIAQEEMDRNTGYWWSPDEAHVAYARVDESPVAEVQRFEIYADDVKVVKQRYPKAGAANALVELYLLDVASGARRKVDLADAVPGLAPTTDYYLARVNWVPDGKHLLVQRQTRDQKRLDLIEVEAATGATRVLLTETSDHWVELNDDLRMLKRRGGFLWVSQRSGFPHVYRYDANGRLVAQLTEGNWLVLGAPRAIVGVDESRGLVYFTGTKDGYEQKHLYSVPLDAKRPTAPTRLTAEPGWHDVQMANDAHSFLDAHSSVDRPPSVALKDASGRRLAWLVENPLDAKHPYAPYLATHPRFEFGTLPAADGTPLPWMRVKPRDFDASKRYPVVVIVYGGPHGRVVTNAWTGGLANYLARRGFLVFSIENRGASRQGVRADVALHRRMGSVEVEDQVAAATWLKRQPYVDPARVGVYGWSYGGYMALNLMTRAPGVYAVGVSGAPVTDWSLYDTHYTERYMGAPADNAAGYAESSVVTHAKNLAAPLLIVHGMADDNVLFAHSTKLFAELQRLRKPFDVMVYPGYKHGLTRQAAVGPHALATIARYLEEHLRPAPVASAEAKRPAVPDVRIPATPGAEERR